MDGWVRFYPAGHRGVPDRHGAAGQRGAAEDRAGARCSRVVDVQEAVGKDPRHYADFSHFTDEGAARAAQALATEILKAGVVAHVSLQAPTDTRVTAPVRTPR